MFAREGESFAGVIFHWHGYSLFTTFLVSCTFDPDVLEDKQLMGSEPPRYEPPCRDSIETTKSSLTLTDIHRYCIGERMWKFFPPALKVFGICLEKNMNA